MTLPEILRARLTGRAGLLVPGVDGAPDALIRAAPGEKLATDLQRRLWQMPGRFYVLGHSVRAHEAWRLSRWPETAEARRIAGLYGAKAVALYEAGEGLPLAVFPIEAWG